MFLTCFFSIVEEASSSLDVPPEEKGESRSPINAKDKDTKKMDG